MGIRIIKFDKGGRGEVVREVVRSLRAGGVIVYPTETVYGLGCLAADEKAVKRIYRIKQRPADSPLILLVKSYRQLRDYCYVSKEQAEYIRSVWPKTTRLAQDPEYIRKVRPTTFILEGRGRLPKAVNGGIIALAVRMPTANTRQNLPIKNFLITILKRVNSPLISTSLNISGQKPPKGLHKLDKYFTIKPDLVVDAGRLPAAKASQIIDIRNINNIKVIRK
jgi:L-threonylcarbamoyladenylate synthase